MPTQDRSQRPRGFMAGRPQEWSDFERRHGLFLERYTNLQAALQAVFARTLTTSSKADRLIFLLSRLCVEDFEEIFLLAANGHGMGALKILRGMYERVVTARHLQHNPNEADDFLDYHWVQRHRLLSELRASFGEAFLAETEDRAKRVEEIQREYDRVKDRFKINKCKVCKTTQINFSWNKLSLVAMAEKTGGALRSLTYAAYYLPLEQVHSTMGAILARLRDSSGGVTYDEAPQRAQSDTALQFGHLLVLNALGLQGDHFDLPAAKPLLDQAFQDYRDIWLREEPGAA
jgi:hypothetical protein